MPKVIQFIHPGPQPPQKLIVGKRKAWNRLPEHKRCFIEAPGQVLGDPNHRAQSHEKVRFWGEWEAEADIVQDFQHPREGEPEMCIRPTVTKPDVFDRHQNTDPFVFDGPFIYCICQQPTSPQLRNLERGDIILFGSSLGGNFVLDTVFVVATPEPYRPGSRVPATAPPSFRAVTNWPLSHGTTGQACAEPDTGCATTEELTFYRGATPDQSVDGMFSFAPAIIPSDARESFTRPSLTATGPLKDCISPGLRQRFRAEPMPTGVRAVWDEVVRRVRAEQLLLGVAFATQFVARGAS